MYLWRRLATPQWWIQNEEILRVQFGTKLCVIEQPTRRRLQIEVACNSPPALKKFGGRVEKLSRDWLKQVLRKQKTKPLKIGNRKLIIPAGAAFGTGEHATTAMSLQLLTRVMKSGRDGSPSRPSNSSDASEKRPYHLVVDLGTGSGILALAARCFGARRVVAIDVDPMAISTAKENARLNKIDNVHFKLADVRRWKFPHTIDIVTANLFSELLIEILPKLRRTKWLIVSGILRDQEKDLIRALRSNKIDIVNRRRRGKWIAILAKL
jgi:ribosomal protein L11 methyltransferase